MTAQDQTTPPQVADPGEFTAAWQAWHAGQEARLADPHGFLAITSLHWLTETPQRFDDAPGAWHTGPDGVTVDLADGEETGHRRGRGTRPALVRGDPRAGRGQRGLG